MSDQPKKNGSKTFLKRLEEFCLTVRVLSVSSILGRSGSREDYLQNQRPAPSLNSRRGEVTSEGEEVLREEQALLTDLMSNPPLICYDRTCATHPKCGTGQTPHTRGQFLRARRASLCVGDGV